MKRYKPLLEDTATSVNTETGVMAWLYFLCYVYHGELYKKSWQNDTRMGVSASEAFVTLKEYLEDSGEKWLATHKAYQKVKEYFLRDTLQDTIELSYNFIPTKNYRINQIPLELWFKINNIKYSADTSYWWNKPGPGAIKKIVSELGGVKNLKYFNIWNAYHQYYPEKIPKILILYRGLKSEYSVEFKQQYTSWSISEKEAERFSKYHFIQHSFGTPVESNIQTILKTQLPFDKIFMFLGGQETEVILKEPIENIEIIKTIKKENYIQRYKSLYFTNK